MNNNGIRLEPDVMKPESVSVISLASDLVSIDDSNMEFQGSARKRPKVEDMKKKALKSTTTRDVDIEELILAS